MKQPIKLPIRANSVGDSKFDEDICGSEVDLDIHAEPHLQEFMAPILHDNSHGDVVIDLAAFPKRVGNSALSPFRYPGGKSFLVSYIQHLIERCIPDTSREYAEPFCGGAGAALLLLKDGIVEKVHLNDADIKIFSAWNAILTENERFIENIQRVEPTMDYWYECREIVENCGKSGYSFELGFATFFLNRTSRSGIISGAGPVGGYKQQGKWKLDARYYPQTLSDRIEWIGKRAQRISLSNEDALSFIHRSKQRLDTNRTYFFIDPPYIGAGGRLYLNAMNPAKHIALRDLLTSQTLKHWTLTYDDAPLVRDAYAAFEIAKISVNYSLQKKRLEKEILLDSGRFA